MCVAIPGMIVELLADGGHFATVDISGVRRKINIDMVSDDGVAPGDWVLIHVGFALSKVSEADAREQLRLLSMLGEQTAAMEEIEGYDF